MVSFLSRSDSCLESIALICASTDGCQLNLANQRRQGGNEERNSDLLIDLETAMTGDVDMTVGSEERDQHNQGTGQQSSEARSIQPGQWITYSLACVFINHFSEPRSEPIKPWCMGMNGMTSVKVRNTGLGKKRPGRSEGMASRSEPGCGRMGAGKWGASPLLPVLKRQHRDRRGIEGQQPIQDATSRNRQPAASNAMPEAGLDSRGGKGVWAYWVNNNATSLPCKAMGATGIAAASCTRWEKHTVRSERETAGSQHKCR